MWHTFIFHLFVMACQRFPYSCWFLPFPILFLSDAHGIRFCSSIFFFHSFCRLNPPPLLTLSLFFPLFLFTYSLVTLFVPYKSIQATIHKLWSDTRKISHLCINIDGCLCLYFLHILHTMSWAYAFKVIFTLQRLGCVVVATADAACWCWHPFL